MRAILLLILLVWLGPAGETAVPSSTPLEQRTQSFTVTVKGSVAEATPLFGPVRESEWAPTWKPHFLHPSAGAQEEGAVFTAVSGDGKERLWLMTGFDANAGQVDYVFISPGFTAAELKIRLVSDGPERCKVTVTYRYSALSAQGNEEVAGVNSDWAEQHRRHWQHGLDTLAETRASHE